MVLIGVVQLLGRFVGLGRARQDNAPHVRSRTTIMSSLALVLRPEDDGVGCGVTERGRVDLGPCFGDVSAWPLADEGERAFWRERPDPIVVLQPCAATREATSAAASSAKDWAGGRSFPVRPCPGVQICRLSAVAQLDPEPEQLRVGTRLRATVRPTTPPGTPIQGWRGRRAGRSGGSGGGGSSKKDDITHSLPEPSAVAIEREDPGLPQCSGMTPDAVPERQRRVRG
jgi:hypothetical protein